MIFLNYRVEAISSDVKLDDEGQEHGWFGKEELSKVNLEKYTQMTIEHYSSQIFK